MISSHLQLATTESFIKTSLTKTVVTLSQSNFPAEKKIAKQRRKFPIQRLQKLSDVQEINNQSFQIDT